MGSMSSGPSMMSSLQKSYAGLWVLLVNANGRMKRLSLEKSWRAYPSPTTRLSDQTLFLRQCLESSFGELEPSKRSMAVDAFECDEVVTLRTVELREPCVEHLA